MQPLRILYVPNEDGDFRQVGFRRPLANLLNAGLIHEISVFSLQWRIRNGGDAEHHRRSLVERVREFQPNLILMQHVGSTGLKDSHFKSMRDAADFELIYHEADPYSRFLHPLPSSAKAAGRASDVVFTVGTGTFSKNFLRSGAKDVRWASHVFETERYRYAEVSNEETRPHDVVVVANKNTPRFRGLPNWKDRIRFIGVLQERFGDRLAIYGNGWSGVGAMGPVDFSKQSAAIRTAWVSANWDHFADEPSYFSNRLPISLAAGSIHATTFHPRYDEIFPEATREFLLTNQTQEALADSIAHYLGTTPPVDRIAAARRAQVFAYEKYRQDDQVVQLLNFRTPWIDARKASATWDIDADPVTDL